jgi:glycosyltransferase involved in cell wall biosynthesis
MRLLVLCSWFPPAVHANAKRPALVVKHCLRAGWEVDVFTSPMAMDPTAAECVHHPRLRIVRYRDPLLWLCSLGSGALHHTINAAVHGLAWPDAHVWWAWRALAAASNGAGYDRVVAFIYPQSLLCGTLRPGAIGPHWVFDYQESVTPYYRILPRSSPVHRLSRPALRRMERQALGEAGCVVFATETNRRAYIEEGLVTPARAVHIPTFFDADDFRAAPPEQPQRFRIGYLGTFDLSGARTPEVFLRALACFFARRPEARSETEFAFHGTWPSMHDRFIAELGLGDVVSIHPPVPHAEYLRLLGESAVLLLVAAREHNLFVPSKAMDYLASGRPILSFVPAGSEVRAVLERAGMGELACDEWDVEGGCRTLERLWDRYRESALVPQPDRAQAWSSDVQAPRYLRVLAEPQRGLEA